MLREEKYCKWCRKPYGGWLRMEKGVQGIETMQYGQKGQKGLVELEEERIGVGMEGMEEEREVRFERPGLERKQAKSGRIWIALGVLMLVLGLAIHGLSGAKGVINEIELGAGQQ